MEPISSDIIGPVLFLDVDGVLNDERILRRAKGPFREIDPIKVGLLNRIVEQTGCRVILTSSWRSQGLSTVQAKLKRCGFRHNLDGATPDLLSNTPGGIFFAAKRGDEIQAWITTNGGIQNKVICILDDEDVSPMDQYLVRCSFSKGLTEFEANLVIEKLLTGTFCL